MTNTEQIQATLQAIDAPVCDDCLALRADIQPRQQVDPICRSLADHGDIDREQGRCSICGEAKIVNSVIAQSQATQEG